MPAARRPNTAPQNSLSGATQPILMAGSCQSPAPTAPATRGARRMPTPRHPPGLARRRWLGPMPAAPSATLAGSALRRCGSPDAGSRRNDLSGRSPVLPQDDPAFNVLTLGKLQGDLSGATTWIYNPGWVYGVLRPGTARRAVRAALFQVEGLTRRISRRLPDGSVEGVRATGCSIAMPRAAEYLEDVPQPVCGGRLRVRHFAACRPPCASPWTRPGRRLWPRVREHGDRPAVAPALPDARRYHVDRSPCRIADPGREWTATQRDVAGCIGCVAPATSPIGD